MDWLQRLTEIGFERAGSWQLSEGRPTCRLISHGASSSVLYAFVAAGEVVYIGKTTMPLSKRMYGYQNPGPSQLTNIYGHAHIAQCLGAGQAVEVYALTDGADLEYGGFKVNLAAGLEDTLISSIRPTWNKAGK
jgi:hypothetical protein